MDKGKSALRLVLLSCRPNNTKGEEYRHDDCAINPTNCQESFRNVFQRYRELLSEKLPLRYVRWFSLKTIRERFWQVLIRSFRVRGSSNTIPSDGRSNHSSNSRNRTFLCLNAKYVPNRRKSMIWSLYPSLIWFSMTWWRWSKRIKRTCLIAKYSTR